jgi:tetratricopeptide (TPR) repeat protein
MSRNVAPGGCRIATFTPAVYLLFRVKPLPGNLSRLLIRAMVASAVIVAAIAAPTAGADDRADAFSEFRRLFEARDYAAAVAPALRVVALTRQMPEADTSELAASLMNLAAAQRLAGDYVDAEQSYLQVIELIEDSGRAVGPRLARANAGLASVYYAGKRYDLAVERFEKAVALSRRTEGLFTEAQLPQLEMYADSLTQLGRYEDALLIQKYRIRTVDHLYGERDIRTVPVLESIGRWYARAGAYETGRHMLIEAIDIVEETSGRKAPELIGPLLALAECNRLQMLDPTQSTPNTVSAERMTLFNDPNLSGLSPGYDTRQRAREGEEALERAAHIAETMPERSPAQVVEVETQFGDWFQLRRDTEEAAIHYKRAWQAAGAVEEPETPLRKQLFDQPVLLQYRPPDIWNRYANRPRDQFEIISIEMDLSVDAKGEVTEVAIISGDEREKLAESAERAARRSLFRPRLVDGEPVEASAVRLSQPFTVLVEDSGPDPDKESPDD